MSSFPLWWMKQQYPTWHNRAQKRKQEYHGAENEKSKHVSDHIERKDRSEVYKPLLVVGTSKKVQKQSLVCFLGRFASSPIPEQLALSITHNKRNYPYKFLYLNSFWFEHRAFFWYSIFFRIVESENEIIAIILRKMEAVQRLVFGHFCLWFFFSTWTLLLRLSVQYDLPAWGCQDHV